MEAPKAYVYNAEVISVYDGDTIKAVLDLGMSVNRKVSCRLYGIDTPELRSKMASEKQAAYTARDRVRDLVLGKSVVLESISKPDKYGRLLVRVWAEDGVCVNDLLVKEGLALPYDGGKKADWAEFLSR